MEAFMSLDKHLENVIKETENNTKKLAPLLPEHKPRYPLGTHRRCVDNRVAMYAIFFVLRTGCAWNALTTTGICSSSLAHRRVQEWRDAGVFERFWQNGLLACEKLGVIDWSWSWSWSSMDGCMTKSPLAGSKKRGRIPPTGETGCKTQPDNRCERATTLTDCLRGKYP